ncbi:ferredoxin:glutaredoxin reductase, partial [Patescibacteria group bacterium]
MIEPASISPKRIQQLVAKLEAQIKNRGYYLNPDRSFTEGLAEGLLINEDRYGYQNCPCRLASGNKEEDLDIICPCDYRDADVSQFGNCFCALYVSRAVVEGQKKTGPVPERRPARELRI